MRDFFQDDFSEMNQYSSNDTLYAFIDHKNERECLEWLNNDIRDKINRAETRLERIRQLEALYKGINYRANDDRNVRDTLGLGSVKPRDAKMFVNFVNEMVEAKVAQRSRFKPSIVVLPNNDDIKDQTNAQSCKQILDCKAQEIDFDKVFSDGDKIQFLRGESYTFVLWDKVAGGVNSTFKKMEELGIKVPGKKNPMNGDVCIKVMGPGQAFPQIDKSNFSDVDDISYIEWVHVDELRALYPGKKIEPSDESMYWDSSSMTRRSLKNHCMVVNYFHKVTRFMEKGSYVKYVNSGILEKKDLTELYDHGKLPCVFDTDIDLEGELHGRPFVENIARLQAVHNMVMASMARGYAIASAPKWVAPQGSVSINKTTNDYGLMEYKGAVPPQLVTYSGVPKDSWEYSDKIERYIEKGSSVYGISRGEPPKGIKAAVALQFLDEQELQRESRGMAKRQRRILDTYKLVLQTMAQHYTPEDGRIFKMLGQDNSYMVKTFNLEGVSSYDIRMQNTSSLPDSKTGKIAAILDINMATQNDPYFGKEEISSILDMGNDQRFRDKLAVSVKAADTVVQRILNGEVNLQPNEWDDFVVQYPIILRALQERQYKDTELGIANELKEYITSMEYLMIEKSKVSPTFAARLQGMYMFPIFYQVPVAPPMPPEEIGAGMDLSKAKESNTVQMQEAQNQEGMQ